MPRPTPTRRPAPAPPPVAVPAVSPAVATPGAATSNYPVLTDKHVVAAVAKYAANEAENRALRREIEAAMGGAPIVCAGLHLVKVTAVQASQSTPNTVITEDMLGQVIPGKKGRSGYDLFKVL